MLSWCWHPELNLNLSWFWSEKIGHFLWINKCVTRWKTVLGITNKCSKFHWWKNFMILFTCWFENCTKRHYRMALTCESRENLWILWKTSHCPCVEGCPRSPIVSHSRHFVKKQLACLFLYFTWVCVWRHSKEGLLLSTLSWFWSGGMCGLHIALWSFGMRPILPCFIWNPVSHKHHVVVFHRHYTHHPLHSLTILAGA